MAVSLDDWKKLSKMEQFEAWKKWNPYTEEGLELLLPEMLEDFREQFPQISLVGWGNVHGEYQIVVDPGEHEYPGSFLGVPVRRAPGR